jgi:hypothetical protein
MFPTIRHAFEAAAAGTMTRTPGGKAVGKNDIGLRHCPTMHLSHQHQLVTTKLQPILNMVTRTVFPPDQHQACV